jgi:hypothetical protein
MPATGHLGGSTPGSSHGGAEPILPERAARRLRSGPLDQPTTGARPPHGAASSAALRPRRGARPWSRPVWGPALRRRARTAAGAGRPYGGGERDGVGWGSSRARGPAGAPGPLRPAPGPVVAPRLLKGPRGRGAVPAPCPGTRSAAPPRHPRRAAARRRLPRPGALCELYKTGHCRPLPAIACSDAQWDTGGSGRGARRSGQPVPQEE